MSFKLKKMAINSFFELREKVLKEWKSDIDLDLISSIKFHNCLPEYKNFVKKIEKYKNKMVMTQLSVGKSLFEQELEELVSFSENAKIDFLSIAVDSFTRENKFENCEQSIINKSSLNGFPLVNYGVEKARKLINEVEVPLQLKHGSTNPKLLVEIALASGITSIEGGGISHNIPFSKSVSLEESIENWKYVDRLVAFYEENGVSINREPYSPLTSTLVPPAISNVIQILEALLAVEQGVKNISLGCLQYGNLIQDIATLQALKEDIEVYCKEFGYTDISFNTVFYQWAGGFPNDSIKCYGIVSYATFVAMLSGADRIFIKNPEEFSTNFLNISFTNTIELTKSIIEMMSSQKNEPNLAVKLEKEQIQKEVKQIITKVLELASGDLTKGIVAAFKQGVIDIPFAPSKYNLGKMMPARDTEGMIRYLDIGNLPFDDEIKEFHQDKIKKRALKENREINFQMTVDDIFSISNGEVISCKKYLQKF